MHISREVVVKALISFIVIVITLLVIFFSYTDKRVVVGSNVGEKLSESDFISSSKKAFVDISGAVNKPGVYAVTPDARLGELLAVADGFASDASAVWVSKNVNLAAKLTDTQKVYIPFAWEVENGKKVILVKGNERVLAPEESNNNATESGKDVPDDSDPPDTTAGTDDSGKVNVNTSTELELDKLPGVGEAYVSKIVKNRPYSTLEDLVTKAGLPNALCQKIKSLITF